MSDKRKQFSDVTLNSAIKEVIDQAVNGGDYFLRSDEVRRLTGLSASTIKRYQAKGLFPGHYFIGLKSKAWLASEVKGWMEDRVRGVPLRTDKAGSRARQ